MRNVGVISKHHNSCFYLEGRVESWRDPADVWAALLTSVSSSTFDDVAAVSQMCNTKPVSGQWVGGTVKLPMERKSFPVEFCGKKGIV